MPIASEGAEVAGPVPGRNYDITPDGKQFLVVVPASSTQSEPRQTQQINVVLNWFEELKQRVPVH